METSRTEILECDDETKKSFIKQPWSKRVALGWQISSRALSLLSSPIDRNRPDIIYNYSFVDNDHFSHSRSGDLGKLVETST